MSRLRLLLLFALVIFQHERQHLLRDRGVPYRRERLPVQSRRPMFAQGGVPLWTNRFDGPGADYATAIAVAIIGLFLLTRPDPSVPVPVAGLLLALLAAVLHAAYIMFGRGGWGEAGDGAATFLIVATAAAGLGVLAAVTSPQAALAPVTDPGLATLLLLEGVLAGAVAPLLFLPLLAPKWILPAIPIQILYLLSTRPDAHTIRGQYVITVSVFLLVATAFAVAELRGPTQPRLAMLLVAGAFLTNVTSGVLHEHPWQWLHRDRPTRSLVAAARMVPARVPVTGSERTWSRRSQDGCGNPQADGTDHVSGYRSTPGAALEMGRAMARSTPLAKREMTSHGRVPWS